MIKYGVHILSVIVLLSCSIGEENSVPKHLEKEAYLAYVKDKNNGLVKRQAFNAIEVSVMYKPHEFIAASERNIETQESLDALKEDLSGTQYYNVRIKSLKKGVDLLKLNSNGSQEDYLKRSTYASFDIHQDFKLVQGSDTINCLQSHHAKHYNIAPTLDFVVVFPETKKEGKRQIIYRDQLFGLGKVKFSFKEADINNIPTLKL